MVGMTEVFGAVADLFDEVRPGYPPELPAAIRAYHGGVPDEVVEVGAGTGKGTEALLRLGAHVTCVEPDRKMAAVLRSRFPQVHVESTRFEDWVPPAGGIPLIASAMSWHWLDEHTRNQRAHAALSPGGTLAVFANKYAYADPALGRALDEAYRLVDPTLRERPDRWHHDDIARSGLFADLEFTVLSRHEEVPAERYLRLVQTFGPYRRAAAADRARALTTAAAVLDRAGGRVVMDVRTTLVLARR